MAQGGDDAFNQPLAWTPCPSAALCPLWHAKTLVRLHEQPLSTSRALRVSGVTAPDSRSAALGSRAAPVRTRHRSSRPAARERLDTAGWCEKREQEGGRGLEAMEAVAGMLQMGLQQWACRAAPGVHSAAPKCFIFSLLLKPVP